MATPFSNARPARKQWDVFVSRYKGDCRHMLVSGPTREEALKTLQLDPEDVIMAVCERPPENA
jgi:hypothetical protein